MACGLSRLHTTAITRLSTARLNRFISSSKLKMASPIRIIGNRIKVVDHDGITIQECVGNAATGVDDLSLALVTVARPTSEPWLTIQYDEYIHVTEGCVELHRYDPEKKESSQITVAAGQTALIEKGTRFQPRFPVANTKYIPVCLPAFKQDCEICDR